MGDIGGLAGALHASFAAAIIIFQYKAVISYVSNHVFLIRDGDELDSVAKIHDERADDSDSSKSETTLKRIPIGFFASIKLSFQRLCDCCGCCHSRRDKLSHLADKLVKEELKIVRWLQHMRCVNLAMKKLFTVTQWQEIEKQALYKTITIDVKTNEEICLEDESHLDIETEVVRDTSGLAMAQSALSQPMQSERAMRIAN